MKSHIFSLAIANRYKIRFLYGVEEVVLDPYYFCIDKSGRKVIYGRTDYSNSIKRYEFGRIANIKILKNIRFSPIIPLAS